MLSLASAQSANADPSAAAPTETVVVTGERPGTQKLIDRTVYTISKDMQSTFGTAADVLNNIPSVIVDADGNVSLRNDSNVVILIDGKPSTQFSGSTGGASLAEIPASDIDRIEVMTTPPAGIKASGSGGVINIVTKKHLDEGLSGLVRGSVGLEGRFVAGGVLSYNTGRFKSSFGIDLRQDVRDRLSRDSRVVTDPITALETASRQSVDETARRLVPSVKASLDYAITSGQTIGVSFNQRNLIGWRDFLQADESGPAGQPIDSQSDRSSRGHEWDTYADEGLHYDGALGANGSLSLSLVRTIKREDEHYAYVNRFTLPVAAPTFDTLRLGLDFKEIDFAADYQRSFAFGGVLKLGYNFDTNDNLFDNSGANIIGGVPIPNPVLSNIFRYRNHVNAGYAEFDATWEAWQVNAGLRYESNSAATLLVTGNVSGRNDDVGFYPSVHLKRTFAGNWDLFANAARRITRPDPEALNPFIDFQDTHNLRAGNASLLPKDTWLYEFGFDQSGTGFNFGATAYYRFDRNSITDVAEPVGPDVVLVRKENLPRSRAFGLELETDGKFADRLGYSLSANVFSMQIDARALGFPNLQTTQGINLKAAVDYRLTADDTFQITFSRTAGRLTPQGTLGPVDVLNVGFKHNIDLQTTLVATLSDLLNGQGLHRVVSTPTLQDAYLRLPYGRILFVGIVYGLGEPLNKKAQEIDYDQ
ncbi:MAG: TonB-dependent receptor [Alphaproteobacteria bacterium]|nr:TonB-dependent receptor [Alphaproteobacteria bacterium]MBL7098632.1 TonB-dependent receptor [Alphaproteobacteria bacterium]